MLIASQGYISNLRETDESKQHEYYVNILEVSLKGYLISQLYHVWHTFLEDHLPKRFTNKVNKGSDFVRYAEWDMKCYSIHEKYHKFVYSVTIDKETHWKGKGKGGYWQARKGYRSRRITRTE